MTDVSNEAREAAANDREAMALVIERCEITFGGVPQEKLGPKIAAQLRTDERLAELLGDMLALNDDAGTTSVRMELSSGWHERRRAISHRIYTYLNAPNDTALANREQSK